MAVWRKFRNFAVMQEKSTVTASYHTLGCKLNFSETSAVARLLAERGVARAGEGDTPDVCVVNTCSVTETADKKGRQLIKRLNRQYPDAVIIVTGCYAQLRPSEAASLPGVAVVAGSNDKLRIGSYLDAYLKMRRPVVDVSDVNHGAEFMPSCERGDRTRFFLKVQDGCDYFCTYCTIPYARGRSRSASVHSIVEQARQAAASGGREIVITGVNIGDYGKGADYGFFDLIRALEGVEGIDRYRISSIEPNLLTEEIVEWVARESRKFMPHFHIPLQAGSDRVLHLMNRRYDTTLFRSRVEMVRTLLPDAFIGIDIMAGARGETPEEFERGVEFVRSLPVSRMHIFPYSERPGTAALHMQGIVSQEEKHRRVAVLNEISEEKLSQFTAAHLGTVRPVLWENAHGKTMHGLTDNYLRVAAPLDVSLLNTITAARLDTVDTGNNEIILGSLT